MIFRNVLSLTFCTFNKLRHYKNKILDAHDGPIYVFCVLMALNNKNKKGWLHAISQMLLTWEQIDISFRKIKTSYSPTSMGLGLPNNVSYFDQTRYRVTIHCCIFNKYLSILYKCIWWKVNPSRAIKPKIKNENCRPGFTECVHER